VIFYDDAEVLDDFRPSSFRFLAAAVFSLVFEIFLYRWILDLGLASLNRHGDAFESWLM